MQKSAKSPLSSASDSNVPKLHSKDNDERKSLIKLPKKPLSTTDRPIIAVVKAQADTDIQEKVDEENDCIIEEPIFNSFSLPSRFKNLPNVSVCLKQEDRVPYNRELKGVKRSPSTGSNSSTGSSEAQKAGSGVPVTKRRKVEKPAPIVIGRDNDCYCWVCHRENIVLCCIACPRAYHSRCAGEISAVSPDWVCPECQKILAAENVDTRSSTLSEISLDKLGALLKLSLNKMKLRAPLAFHQPVSLEHYPMYLHYVIHPMDLTLLEKNIKQKLYGCTEAFLADVKWIAHNSCVFNGPQHPLSTNAKNLVKSCDQDMQEIEICPDCFVHSIVRAKYWFSEVCRKPHPLVWAKLKGFPYWPAKVVRILDGNVDARFFGAHDRAWVPISQCYHLSKEMPTSSKPKKKGNYEVALEELNVHVHLLIQQFKSFEYAPYRTVFNTENKYLMYHSIDVDKACKEDISFDTNATPKMRYPSPEKENRFAKYMENEDEKMCVDEGKFEKSLSENSKAQNSQTDEENSFSFLFKERPIFSPTKKEVKPAEKTVEKGAVEEKNSNAEEKKNDNLDIPRLKKPEAISDAEQLRKLELALERIKGIVSVSADSDKETDEKDVEVNDEKKEDEKGSFSEKETDLKEKERHTSPLIKHSITLPLSEKNYEPEIDKVNENVNVPLEATKKKDSFSLKLNETIESCKAKLGISEINDDLSDDDSVADENASGSDEDEGEDTSASEADEENSSSEEDEVDEEENKNADTSDDDEEEAENDVEIEEIKDGPSNEVLESEGSDYVSEDESSSESISSGTDVEDGISKRVALKKPKHVTNSIASEDSLQAVSESNDATSINEGIQMAEASIDDSGAHEENEESRSSNENENVSRSEDDKKSQSVTDESKNCDKALHSGHASPHTLDDASEIRNDSDSKADDDSYLTHVLVNNKVENKAASMKNTLNGCDKFANLGEPSSSNNLGFVGRSDKMQDKIDEKEHDGIKKQNNANKSSVNVSNNVELCKDDQDDDEVIICNSPKTEPPVIVIDDDQEVDESSTSNTLAIKTPPYSTSAESSVYDENPSRRKKLDDDYHDDAISQRNTSLNSLASNETIVGENRMTTRSSKRGFRGRKRILISDSSNEDDDDDDVQIVTAVKKNKLTGAIRTFNKPDNNHLMPVDKSQEIEEEILEKENNIPESMYSPNKSKDFTDYRDFPMSPPRSLPQSPGLDSNLSETEKLMYLRSKLQCVLRAYQIQRWKSTQEREELRHNMNLVIMEMRASLEADKKQAVEALSRSFEQEKQKYVEETKKKQWCASCLMESRYACCWNTSYCSVSCQKRHFSEHRSVCTQLKNKATGLFESKAKVITTTAEVSENKEKVIFLKMKPTDAAKVAASAAAEITTSSVCSPRAIAPRLAKHPPQIHRIANKSSLHVSATQSTSSTSSPIQFYIAPMKSSVSSSVPLKSLTEIVKPSSSLALPVPVILTSTTKSSVVSPVSSVTATQLSALICPSVATTQSSTLVLPSVAVTQSALICPSIVTTAQSSTLVLPSVGVTHSSTVSSRTLTAVMSPSTPQPVAVTTPVKIEPSQEQNLVLKIKTEENKQSEPKEESNLEQIYFPLPPTVTFEGYESVSPEPNLVIDEYEAEATNNSDAEVSDKGEDVTPEQDIVLSDNDDINNEMVNIGRGIEIKAKFLNKCLVYGHTPKKLTRCLVDVIFSDIKLLANCSAFGKKSNVTKLTRAALPTRKIYAIIDFVSRRFPQATRNEIVLAVNMKCKEARVILNRMKSDTKTTERKSWLKDDEKPTSTSTTSNSSSVTSKTIANVVSIKSSHQASIVTTLNLPKSSSVGPNLTRANRANPQLLLRPKPILSSLGSVSVVSGQPSVKRRETVKSLLKNRLAVTTTSSVVPTNTTANSRSLIILGSTGNTAKQATSQNPTAAVSPTIKK